VYSARNISDGGSLSDGHVNPYFIIMMSLYSVFLNILLEPEDLVEHTGCFICKVPYYGCDVYSEMFETDSRTEDASKGITIEIKKPSGALVRQRTIPTQRPPLVGEVSANFSG
jgi:hypothetical protein